MIIASAVLFLGEKYPVIFSAKRHHEAWDKLYQYIRPTGQYDVIEGFLTDENQFLNRRESVYEARKCHQVDLNYSKDLLFSEDIWKED